MRIGSLTSPGLHVGDQVADELRQLVHAPPAELAALERGLRLRVGERELAEVLALQGAAVDVVRKVLDLRHFLRRRRLGQREQDVRDVVFRIRVRLARIALERLVELARRDVDARIHVALPEQRQHDLAPHLLAIGGVVEALLLERHGHLLERDVVALRDVAQRLVQRFVGHLHAEARRALHLDLLQDQALEHLLADDVGRRHLRALAAQALGDERRLRVELALQHDAVVDDRDHAVERDAACGHVARLREGGAREQERAKETGQDSAHGQPESGASGCGGG